MYAYVYNRLRLQAESEEMVQEVFVAFWANHRHITVTDSLASYLFTSLKNRLLEYFRSEKVRNTYAEHFTHFLAQDFENSTDAGLHVEDLQKLIAQAIGELPNKCQQVFWMSRRDHLSIQEIAAQLQISPKTVENYLTTALKHLRLSLDKFMLLVFIFLY